MTSDGEDNIITQMKLFSEDFEQDPRQWDNRVDGHVINSSSRSGSCTEGSCQLGKSSDSVSDIYQYRASSKLKRKIKPPSARPDSTDLWDPHARGERRIAGNMSVLLGCISAMIAMTDVPGPIGQIRPVEYDRFLSEAHRVLGERL